MKYHLVALTHLASLSVAAQSQVQKSMLDTFVKYASIDNQSDYDSICAQGQHNMALALKADIEEAVVNQRHLVSRLNSPMPIIFTLQYQPISEPLARQWV
ncbi:MAG: hypothetical protein ACI3X8_09105 [Alloprevotella sp.]